jgi:hypothetical protein
VPGGDAGAGSDENPGHWQAELSTLDSTVSLHRTRPNRFVTARVPAYLASGRLLREELARPCCLDADVVPDPRYGPTLLVELGGFVHLSLIQAEASHPDALAMQLHRHRRSVDAESLG